MGKNLLLVEPDYDFSLLAMTCSLKGYRLAWLLNKVFHCSFCKLDDLIIKNNRSGEDAFQVFSCYHTDFNCLLYLYGNKAKSDYLIPEQKAFDFYLKIESEDHALYIDNYLNKTKNITQVSAIYKLNIAELKSKKNLLL
jgi:hypothetical protein